MKRKESKERNCNNSYFYHSFDLVTKKGKENFLESGKWKGTYVLCNGPFRVYIKDWSTIMDGRGSSLKCNTVKLFHSPPRGSGGRGFNRLEHNESTTKISRE